ncbi:helix-turn-helix domain-containing protein [Pyruvatibacter mobilis]|uniref:helix-turn-helix domain-containing protein n=1 Tax=Pyruvatibacter mobilis TaxID=1712261 RepID=UPI003BB0CE15
MSDFGDPFVSSLFPFASERLQAHALPAMSVLQGLDGPILLETGAARVEGDVLLVRQDIHHQVWIGGRARILNLNGLVYPFGDELARPLTGPLRHVALDALLGDRAALAELRLWLGHRQPACPDDIARVLRRVGADPMVRMSQQELAASLGMERTRALRYFKSATGMTFRRFKSWSALQDAARQLMGGGLVRDAALDNGFADSAHLSRSFRVTLGLTPRDAVAGYRAAIGAASQSCQA